MEPREYKARVAYGNQWSYLLGRYFNGNRYTIRSSLRKLNCDRVALMLKLLPDMGFCQSCCVQWPVHIWARTNSHKATEHSKWTFFESELHQNVFSMPLAPTSKYRTSYLNCNGNMMTHLIILHIVQWPNYNKLLNSFLIFRMKDVPCTPVHHIPYWRAVLY